MRSPGALVLAGLSFGCLLVAALTEAKWAAVGFLLFGGLAFVLFPRQAAGESDSGPGMSQYAWVLPESQPARTIAAVILGVIGVGLAVAYAFS